MKRCPKCGADYFDNMLEFCLDDGVRLTRLESQAVAVASRPEEVLGHPSQETVVLTKPASRADTTLEIRGETETVAISRPVVSHQNSSTSGDILAYTSIAAALAHNWWQWLYLEDQYVYTVASYIFSANFLMWLMLLIGGAALGMVSLKQSRTSKLPYISLTILAINLILFLVPRR